jgi:hypothetical protein
MQRDTSNQLQGPMIICKYFMMNILYNNQGRPGQIRSNRVKVRQTCFEAGKRTVNWLVFAPFALRLLRSSRSNPAFWLLCFGFYCSMFRE